MKVVFDPEKSSAEDIEVSYRERAIIFKRGKPVECNEELSKLLLTDPSKFKAVDN